MSAVSLQRYDIASDWAELQELRMRVRAAATLPTRLEALFVFQGALQVFYDRHHTKLDLLVQAGEPLDALIERKRRELAELEGLNS